MYAALTVPVADAVARASETTLIFDAAVIAARMTVFATAAHAARISVLFAAKSFPHPAIRALAAERLDGFDAASAGEVRALAPRADRVLSVVDPSGMASAAGWPGRAIIGCETAAQVAAAPPHADIAIRLSASLTARDPAIGGVLEGSGRRRSRFGLDLDPARRRTELAAIARAAGGRTIGLHVHHGPVLATTAERFIATAHAALAVAADAEIVPRFLDLGGAWHGIPDAQLAAVLAAIRAAVPAELELIIEPGRTFALGAGYATGRVASTRELDDRLLWVTELSRSAHLRWTQPELVAPAPRPGLGRDVLIVGPTCYEDDVIGEWTVEPDRIGDRIVLRNVTGYAVAWNVGFAGVPPAAIAMV